MRVKLSPLRLDLAVGILLGIEMQVEAAFLGVDAAERWEVHGLLFALAAAMVVRRRAPLAAFLTAQAVFVATQGMGRDVTDALYVPLFLCIFLTYSAAANAGGRRIWVVPPIAYAVGIVGISIDDYDESVTDDLLWLGLIFVAAPVVLGRLIHNRSNLQRALAAKAARLEREQAEREAEAVVAERTRIAGELHDIVAHALSEMVIQASAAKRLAGRADAYAGEALLAIEGRGRDALDELRRLVGILRQEGDALPLAPVTATTIDALDALLAAPAVPPSRGAEGSPAEPAASSLRGRLGAGFRALSPRARDALIAAGLFLVCAFEVVMTDARDGAVVPNVLAVAALTAPMAWRRRAPMRAAVAVFAVAVFMTTTLTGVDDLSGPFLVVLVLAFSMGQLPTHRGAVGGLLLVWAGICAISASMPDPILGDFLFPMGFAAATWGGSRAVTHRSQLTAELHEAALRAEQAREEQAARAVAEERRRIAREMHDVIAHSVSVMVVQAGGARRILDRDPARAAEAAELIERTGRSALAEMRRLLGALGPTEPGASAALLAPQPTLDGLEALVGRARDAGVPVNLELEGERRPLPAGLDLAAYRIVQEALTNVVKHAERAPTDVLVRWGVEDLRIVIVNRPAATAPRSAAAPSGHGLVGMRERVQLFGGDLFTGPAPAGGYEVRARLPLAREAVVA
jgi:signal transduction histidine kinase